GSGGGGRIGERGGWPGLEMQAAFAVARLVPGVSDRYTLARYSRPLMDALWLIAVKGADYDKEMDAARSMCPNLSWVSSSWPGAREIIALALAHIATVAGPAFADISK
ncbi:unnamed protein product, partial [Choristocarpus tenellus]